MQIDSGDQESSVWDFSVNFYRESFASARGQKVMQQILDETLFLLQQQRHSFLEKKPVELPKLFAVRDIILMLISLDLYKSTFEKKLLDKTSYFYQMQSRDLIKKYEIPDYLRLVLQIIQNE